MQACELEFALYMDMLAFIGSETVDWFTVRNCLCDNFHCRNMCVVIIEVIIC